MSRSRSAAFVSKGWFKRSSTDNTMLLIFHIITECDRVNGLPYLLKMGSSFDLVSNEMSVMGT